MDKEIQEVENKILCGSIAERLNILIMGDCTDEYCEKNSKDCCLKHICGRSPYKL